MCRYESGSIIKLKQVGSDMSINNFQVNVNVISRKKSQIEMNNERIKH